MEADWVPHLRLGGNDPPTAEDSAPFYVSKNPVHAEMRINHG